MCEAAGVRAVSRFGVPALDELPDDVRARIEEVGEKTGFVPNVFLALARRPAEFRAFVAYHDALMDKQTPGLSKADREMIVVATSAANDCTYCVVAHGAILRIRAKDPLLADQVAVNYRHADITARQRAMLDFALRVADRVRDRRGRAPGRAGPPRVRHRRRLGHRRDRGAVRAVQPDGAPDGAAARIPSSTCSAGCRGPDRRTGRGHELDVPHVRRRR